MMHSSYKSPNKYIEPSHSRNSENNFNGHNGFQAHVATFLDPPQYDTNSEANISWYLDSVASHHATPHLQSIPTHHPYLGQGQVQSGNGSSLQIQNFGDDHLSYDDKTFKLKSIIHVPSLNTSLLYVHNLLWIIIAI